MRLVLGICLSTKNSIPHNKLKAVLYSSRFFYTNGYDKVIFREDNETKMYSPEETLKFHFYYEQKYPQI